MNGNSCAKPFTVKGKTLFSLLKHNDGNNNFTLHKIEFSSKKIGKELGITFNEFIKADVQSIEENNGLLWAKKVFKTKPSREVSEEFKTKIKTIFHHLTKEELVEKILANYLSSTNLANTKVASKNKHQK